MPTSRQKHRGQEQEAPPAQKQRALQQAARNRIQEQRLGGVQGQVPMERHTRRTAHPILLHRRSLPRARTAPRRSLNAIPTRERRGRGPAVRRRGSAPWARDNVPPAHRPLSVAAGSPIHPSATARYRVSVPVEVAACQRREDGLYRRRVPAGADRVGREAARVQEVRRQAGSRAIRGQDSDRHRDLDRGRGVPAPRGALTAGVREDATQRRRRGRRNGGLRSSKRSQPAPSLFHHRSW